MQEYDTAKKMVSALSEKLQETKKRFKAFDEGYSELKQNRVYRVIQPESNSTKTSALKENELVSIIADSLLGEPYAVQLVARFSGNNLEMEKDWEMMSEFDKDEIIHKKIIRELQGWSEISSVALEKSGKVHFPLILRISGKNPYYNAINSR